MQYPLNSDVRLHKSSDEEVVAGAKDNFDGHLTESIENRLSPGSTLDRMDQAYLLYFEYGQLTGFNVKKGMQKYSLETHVVRVKEFLCSCHGKRNSKQLNDRLHLYRK